MATRPENLPTWQYLIGLLPDRLTTYVIGASLYALVAGIVQRINYKYIIVRGRRALPALFFFLFVSTNLDTFPLRPVSLSLIGLTLALSQLLGSFAYRWEPSSGPTWCGSYRSFGMACIVSAPCQLADC